ncbi:hypothetical protein Agabi119p4_1431 [Agaricus bisporus var. burnettii]|uniref:Uncharacterized protein n=1 Tax=Agaricus bisporus var. burnettii TaxID=192524 RepID=A0A8H7F9S8_AGABI|nr:hypothetical protein Agabi119p4_1431 [Agaricus bisporus var. burnettii]
MPCTLPSLILYLQCSLTTLQLTRGLYPDGHRHYRAREFKIPAPPPLRSGEPYVPVLLFAYPLPDDCLERWAKTHNIPEGDENDLCQDAFHDIRRRPPPRGWCRVAQVYYDDWKVAPALVIATNRSKEEMILLLRRIRYNNFVIRE